MSDGAVRANIRKETWLPAAGPDSPLLVGGDPTTSKLRFVNVAQLPDSFLSKLLPEQRELIEQLLTIPMGSTRWGGRRLDEATLNR